MAKSQKQRGKATCGHIDFATDANLERPIKFITKQPLAQERSI